MNKTIGYKAFTNMKDRYNNTYEIGKTYSVKGKIKWQENGFHFCKNLEDVFRYYDGFDENTDICLVKGFGTIKTYYDNYFEYYDMYVSSDISIIKKLSREEIIEKVIHKSIFSITRLISGYKLTDNEINYILENSDFRILKPYINYYQKNDKTAFQRKRN